MACNTYYSEPYFWFLIVSIILFIIFIALVETRPMTTGFMSAGLWVLFLFIILFFIISLVWYYYDCVSFRQPVLQPIYQPLQPIQPQPIQPIIEIIENECSVYEPMDEYIPLSALNPLL